MRRPLFTTGIPQLPPELASIVATPNSALSVLDLRSLSDNLQSYTRFVTLYAANQNFGFSDTIEIAWRTGTDTPVLLAEIDLPQGYVTGGPVKVLDRFPLRGDAELLVSQAVGDASVVWGYYELDTSTNFQSADRPLQPGALVSPFTYEPIAVTAGTIAATDLHTFVENYFDEITLDAVGVMLEAIVLNLTITDGTDTITFDIGGVGDTPTRIFDGIPMGSIVAAGGSISVESGAVLQAAVYGSFRRIS